MQDIAEEGKQQPDNVVVKWMRMENSETFYSASTFVKMDNCSRIRVPPSLQYSDFVPEQDSPHRQRGKQVSG
jgi:hypothetical protein